MSYENNLKNELHVKQAPNIGQEISTNIIKQLKGINLNPKKYLKMVKFVAENRGYNPDLIKFSDDGLHKFEYDGVKFGRVGYNDKIIYTWLEHNNILPDGTAEEKYLNYRKRAYNVMKKTNNKYSPASLSYYILW